MNNITGIFSSQLQNNSEVRSSRNDVAGKINFIDAARSVAASQIAVAERGTIEEMALRKKSEGNLNIFGSHDSEDEIDEIISKIMGLVKQIKDFQQPDRLMAKGGE